MRTKEIERITRETFILCFFSQHVPLTAEWGPCNEKKGEDLVRIRQ
jgi:hypothetical protein